jgi:flagellar biosynthesis anti-sigma factor FlgM
MAVKNVASPLVSGVGLGKSKDTETVKKSGVSDIGPATVGQQGVPSSSVAGRDFGVQLSDSGKKRAEEQKKAFEIAKNTPDVREDKVAAIKAKIQAGTYEVDSGKIVDGMLREAIMEHLATGKDS